MKLSGDSIVDTVIDYANVKFGVEMDMEQVSQQLKNMTFSQTLKLVDAIKNEDDDAFADYIDMSVTNEAYGTGNTSASAATNRSINQAQRNDDRRDTNLAMKSIRRGSNDRYVAGGQKAATGVRTTVDPATKQRDSNAQATADNAAASEQNAKDIARLRQLINKGR